MGVDAVDGDAVASHLFDEEAFDGIGGGRCRALDLEVAEDEDSHVPGICEFDMGALEGDRSAFPDAALWVDDVVVADVGPAVAAVTLADLLDAGGDGCLTGEGDGGHAVVVDGDAFDADHWVSEAEFGSGGGPLGAGDDAGGHGEGGCACGGCPLPDGRRDVCRSWVVGDGASDEAATGSLFGRTARGKETRDGCCRPECERAREPLPSVEFVHGAHDIGSWPEFHEVVHGDCGDWALCSGQPCGWGLIPRTAVLERFGGVC